MVTRHNMIDWISDSCEIEADLTNLPIAWKPIKTQETLHLLVSRYSSLSL